MTVAPRKKRRSYDHIEVPDAMWALAVRRGGDHLVRYRSIEDNMGNAYLQGFHDAFRVITPAGRTALGDDNGQV